MKFIYILSTFFFCFNIHSQNIEIEYRVYENTNDPILSTSTNYNLILKDNKSVYFNINDSIQQFNYKNAIFDIKKIGELTRVKLSDNHFSFIKQDYFYKDYEKDTLIYNEIIINKKIFIGENINLFDWKIVSNSDSLILGFKCQKATTAFRGRNYEAYFSSELAPFGGPWKFDGLPGTILSIKSLDGYFVIEPMQIIKNPKFNNQTKYIFKNEEIITWNNFKKLYRLKLEEQLKRMKSLSEDGEGGSIKITDKIEDLEIPELKF